MERVKQIQSINPPHMGQAATGASRLLGALQALLRRERVCTVLFCSLVCLGLFGSFTLLGAIDAGQVSLGAALPLLGAGAALLGWMQLSRT